jgi:hypothetical protein
LGQVRAIGFATKDKIEFIDFRSVPLWGKASLKLDSLGQDSFFWFGRAGYCGLMETDTELSVIFNRANGIDKDPKYADIFWWPPAEKVICENGP